MTKLWRIGAAVAVFSLIPHPALPQGETTSAIAGQVTDQTGAPIHGANVSVSNSANGLRRSVETDETGRFSFPQLIPGT
jgi:protocatechuate 3,4-dioxygenase beta subunit